MTTNINVHPNWKGDNDYEAEFRKVSHDIHLISIKQNKSESIFFLDLLTVEEVAVFVDSLEIAVDEIREWLNERMVEHYEDAGL